MANIINTKIDGSANFKIVDGVIPLLEVGRRFISTT